ncbi:MAG: hypothetical protein K8I04_10815, partial [Gammaproteobacteria bacterium]|nr:hypothetical protein [Gammaproteobacteria bacterium]
MPTKEICNKLDISATNCGVMLYRARMSLRLSRSGLCRRWRGNGVAGPEHRPGGG